MLQDLIAALKQARREFRAEWRRRRNPRKIGRAIAAVQKLLVQDWQEWEARAARR